MSTPETVVTMTVSERLAESVSPMINAGGANTEKSGSRMRPEALAAMNSAAGQYVPPAPLNNRLSLRDALDRFNRATRCWIRFFSINELLDTAGEMVVELIEGHNGNVPNLQAACICAGAATGMSLMAAATLTCGKSERRAALPHTDGFPNELVAQRSHSINYDQSWQTTGAKLVFAGNEDSCSAEELQSAICNNTCGLIFLAEKRGTLSLEEIVQIGAAHDLPVIVDAASVLGGAEARYRLSKYLAAGADLVCFKGGGGIRGPQSTGLVLGKADLVEECRLNAFPNQAVMRAAKVCKEEIFGLVAAVEGFMAEDDAELTVQDAARMQRIVDAVAEIDGVVSSVIDKEDGSGPKALINLRPSDGWRGPDAAPILEQLLNHPHPGHPRLFCGPPGEGYSDPRPDAFTITAQMLEDGEEETVIEVLMVVLAEHAARASSKL